MFKSVLTLETNDENNENRGLTGMGLNSTLASKNDEEKPSFLQFMAVDPPKFLKKNKLFSKTFSLYV